MIWKILIVDDDLELLSSLSQGMEPHRQRLSVLTAGSVSLAREALDKHLISLVVTDVKMPGKDGFGLVSILRREYPDIPFMLITGFGNPKMKDVARELGAEGYMEKPFSLQTFSSAVTRILGRLAEGGALQGVSPGMFLQLIEMEQKTCTIRLSERNASGDGVLFFRRGELLDARTGGLRGEPAAYEIFGMEEVDLAIENRCPPVGRKIRGDLQAVLLEAMRRKDEKRQQAGAKVNTGRAGAGHAARGLRGAGTPPAGTVLENVRRRLERLLGERSALKEITQDDTWDGLLAQMSRMGSLFQCGRLLLTYMEVGDNGGQNLLILPGENSIAVTLHPSCPRDRVLDALSRDESSPGGESA